MAATIYNPERAAGLVVSGWELASGTATSAVASLATYIDDLKAAGLALDLSNIDVDLDKPTTVIPDLTLPSTDLTAPDLSITAPALPTAPTLDSVRPIDAGDVPEFLAQYPQISLPNKPTVATITSPGDAPSVTTPVLPDDPTFTIPDVPTLRSLSLPDVPALSNYVFTEIIPAEGDLPNAPGDTFTWSEDDYGSTILTAYNQKLLDDITNGTSGLAEWVEAQFFDRLRNRVEEANLAQKQATYDEFAARGFDIPPGALAEIVYKIEKDAADRTAAAARETYIKQAELAVQQLQFAITSAIQSEGQLITYTGFLQQRALDAAKFAFQAGIDLYNAKVAVFQLRLTRYQAAADVFKTLVDADLSKLELYKTQLEGQRLVGELNVQDIQIYSAQIDSVKAIVDVYRTQVDAAKAEIEIDAVRIDAFKASVDAYKARVDANIAEYQVYSEEIKGELAKVELYGEEVDAYKARIDGYGSYVEALTKINESDIQTNKLEISKYSAQLDGYKIGLQAEVARIDAESKAYDATVRSFTAELSGEQSKVEAAVRKYDAEIKIAEATARLEVQQAAANIQSSINEANFMKDAYDAGARAYTALASSALSAVNLGASIGETVNESATYGWSGKFDADIGPIVIKP